MRVLLIAATLALLTLAPTASAEGIAIVPCEDGGYEVIIDTATTGCVIPGIDPPGTTGIYGCGDQVAVGIVVNGNNMGCVGLNVYVIDCPSGIRLMIGDHPTQCIPIDHII